MDLDDTIQRHGMALISVFADHPHDLPFTYTVGRHDRGLPELIVFGGTPDEAGTLLNELDRDNPSSEVRPGRTPRADALGGARVELRRARPAWAKVHGLLAFDRGGPDVPFLQVRLPDRRGRLHGERGRPAACACCPDLSRADRPWALPLDTASLHGRVLPSQARSDDAVEVCLPVRRDGTEVGRVERVRARDLGDGTVQVLQPPVMADWTTAGAVLLLEGRTDLCGDPLAASEVRASRSVHLAWSWIVPLLDEDGLDLERVDAAVGRVAEMPGVALTIDTWWCSVAAQSNQSHRVRAAMRRLVRDGLAREEDRYSRSDPPGLPCLDPRCVRCDTQLRP